MSFDIEHLHIFKAQPHYVYVYFRCPRCSLILKAWCLALQKPPVAYRKMMLYVYFKDTYDNTFYVEVILRLKYYTE